MGGQKRKRKRREDSQSTDKNAVSNFTLPHLPDEIWKHILSFIPIAEEREKSITCRLFYNICLEEEKKLIKQFFTIYPSLNSHQLAKLINFLIKNINIYNNPEGEYFLKLNLLGDFKESLISLLKDYVIDPYAIIDHGFFAAIINQKFLYSLEGKEFHPLDNAGVRCGVYGMEHDYKLTVRTQEASKDAFCIISYTDKENRYDVRREETGDIITSFYSVSDKEEIRRFILNLLVEKNVLIPLKRRETPKWLLKFNDSDQYIFITYKEDYIARIGNKNGWRLLLGTANIFGMQHIEIDLNDDVYKQIYIPLQFEEGEHNPDIISKDDVQHMLAKIDCETFNFATIGIQIEPFNHRVTPLDKHKLDNNLKI